MFQTEPKTRKILVDRKNVMTSSPPKEKRRGRENNYRSADPEFDDDDWSPSRFETKKPGYCSDDDDDIFMNDSFSFDRWLMF